MPLPLRTNKTPVLDSGLGLVLRLNNLWIQADAKHLSGDIEAWNATLDVIYNTLNYDTKLEITKDKDGNILDVKSISEHNQIYLFFNKKIYEARLEKETAIKKKNAVDLKNSEKKIQYYIQEKDKWIRNYMHKVGLYLKEYSNDHGGGIWS